MVERNFMCIKYHLHMSTLQFQRLTATSLHLPHHLLCYLPSHSHKLLPRYLPWLFLPNQLTCLLPLHFPPNHLQIHPSQYHHQSRVAVLRKLHMQENSSSKHLLRKVRPLRQHLSPSHPDRKMEPLAERQALIRAQPCTPHKIN